MKHSRKCNVVNHFLAPLRVFAAPGGGSQRHGPGSGGFLDLLPLPLLGQLFLSQGAGFLLGLQPLLQLGDGLLVFLLSLDGPVEPEEFDSFESFLSRLFRARPTAVQYFN